MTSTHNRLFRYNILMKNSKNIGILAAVVFTVGIVGFNLSDGVIGLGDNVSLATMEGAVMTGHLEVIHTDQYGNIISYQQMDNAIMNIARNCVANMLFGFPANTVCTDETPGVYNVIGLGNATAIVTDNNALEALVGEITVAGDGLRRIEPTFGPTVSEIGTATGATGGSSTTRISAEFTYTGSQQGNPIATALLANGTTPITGDVFAIKDFSTAVALNTNDKLTVNWDISISGTDTIAQ